jgi:hypothetical protein
MLISRTFLVRMSLLALFYICLFSIGISVVDFSEEKHDYTNKLWSVFRIAGDVVMLSHLALKLHYVRQETDQLAIEETTLASRLVSLRLEQEYTICIKLTLKCTLTQGKCRSIKQVSLMLDH